MRSIARSRSRLALGFGCGNGDRVQGRDVGRGRVLHGSRVRVLVVRSRGRVPVWLWSSGSVVEIEFGIGRACVYSFSGRIASWRFPLVLTGPNLPIYQIWRTSSANLPIYQIYLASAGLLRPFTVKPKGNLADAPKTGVGRFTKPSLPTLNLPR